MPKNTAPSIAGKPASATVGTSGSMGTLLRGDGEAAQPTVLHREAARQQRVGEQHDVATQHVLQRIGAALVADMLELDAGLRAELLTPQVRNAGVARRGEADLRGLRLGPGDQLGHRLERRIVAGGEQDRHVDEANDRREILHRIVGQLYVERGVGGDRARRQQDRVTVGFCLATISVPMMVPPPGLLSTITCWPSLLRQDFGSDARRGIGGAARRIGHDEADRLSGKAWARVTAFGEIARAAAEPSRWRRFIVSSRYSLTPFWRRFWCPFFHSQRPSSWAFTQTCTTFDSRNWCAALRVGSSATLPTTIATTRSHL